MVIDKNCFLLYISQKTYFSKLLKAYTVLVSQKNILTAKTLQNTKTYLAYQSLKSKPENFNFFLCLA